LTASGRPSSVSTMYVGRKPAFISEQVLGARYFFLDLEPRGDTDPSGFNRVFKRVHGVTPAVFLRSAAARRQQDRQQPRATVTPSS
jgi:hypothetical protein